MPADRPTAVVRAMVDDIDLERVRRYEQLGHAVLDRLKDLELTGRTDWLALPLNQKDAVVSAFRAARAEVSLQLGLMPAVVTDAEVRRRLEQAERIQAQWSTGVSMRPASEA
ncbi:hypothetical protein [Streptomyces sp. NPDC047981]|uniref:hypothetical protein n=1 Tax=Streptomyces sp. NPDC047981 TaxID=3154610 RepID=UPI0034277C5C